MMQISDCRISLWNIIFWYFLFSKYDFYVTAFCNLSCILNCLSRIWKQLCHFLRRFYKILSALITHTVFVLYFLPCLDAKQDIVCLCIFLKCIMNIICGNQIDPCLFRHLKKCRIYLCLIWNSMIL